MNRFLHFFLLTLLCGLLMLSPGCRPDDVIPRDDMVTLFSEFYLADASIDVVNSSSTVVRGLDSLRVYAPILEKMGYSKEDFRTSLSYYLHHPDDMEIIFTQVEKRLAKQAEKISETEVDLGDLRISEEEEEEILEGTEPEIEKEGETEKVSQAEEQSETETAVTKRGRKKMSRKDLKKLEEELK